LGGRVDVQTLGRPDPVITEGVISDFPGVGDKELDIRVQDLGRVIRFGLSGRRVGCPAGYVPVGGGPKIFGEGFGVDGIAGAG